MDRGAAAPRASGTSMCCAERRESRWGEHGQKDERCGVVSEVFREQADGKRE